MEVGLVAEEGDGEAIAINGSGEAREEAAEQCLAGMRKLDEIAAAAPDSGSLEPGIISIQEPAEQCLPAKRKLDEVATSDTLPPEPACKQTFSRAMTRQFAQKVGYQVPSLQWFQPFSLPKLPKRCRKTHPSNSKKRKKIDTNMFESYLERLWRYISEDKRKSCTYLDCLWFSLYKKGSDKVLMWITRKDIFSRTYVFIPIICCLTIMSELDALSVDFGQHLHLIQYISLHLNDYWKLRISRRHWSLLIFCHFGEDLQSKTRTPCMLLLDSLEMTNPKRLEPDIRRFVLDIFRSDGREEREELISEIPLLVPKVPQQTNGEECGLFVLYFIKLFLQSAPGNFSIFEGYPYFMNKNWFDRKALEKFHKQIHSRRR